MDFDVIWKAIIFALIVMVVFRFVICPFFKGFFRELFGKDKEHIS